MATKKVLLSAVTADGTSAFAQLSFSSQPPLFGRDATAWLTRDGDGDGTLALYVSLNGGSTWKLLVASIAVADAPVELRFHGDALYKLTLTGRTTGSVTATVYVSGGEVV